MKKKKTTVFLAVALRISLLVFACWFLLSGLLTWAVAADMREQIESNMRWVVQSFSTFRRVDNNYAVDLPGAMEANTLSFLPNLYYFFGTEPLLPVVLKQTPDSYGSTDWFWGKNDLLYGVEPAAVLYDMEGNVIAKSHDYISFAYYGKAGQKTPTGMGYIDISALPDIQELDRILEVSPGAQFFAGGMDGMLRLTGYFEGNRFYPSMIDHKYSQLSDWQNLLELPADNSVQTQIIYARDLTSFSYNYDKLRMDGVTYDTLADFVEANPEYAYEGNLWETVLVMRSHTIEDDYGEHYYYLAARFWPLGYACLRLLPFYLISVAVIGLALHLFLRRLRKNLIAPMEYLKRAVDYGTTLQPSAAWEELYALENHFANSRQLAAENGAKIQQLQTALDYAHEAEEKRKQLISNITHELKTPLAVIHSYAEALQEDIAQQKREHYLSVILEESEQMDAMVLQLLDLSRLEAGKVRLASDRFSLLQLSLQITEKFAPMVEEKQLQLQYVQAEDFLITADSQRIGQVITNLVSNAVKYASTGGDIYVFVSVDRNGVHYRIENTVEKPLPEESLSKVWDSFYRVDPSRTEPGTGLGLTIVKQIITLHGGTCGVRNVFYQRPEGVKIGVEVGFTIPSEGSQANYTSS